VGGGVLNTGRAVLITNTTNVNVVNAKAMVVSPPTETSEVFVCVVELLILPVRQKEIGEGELNFTGTVEGVHYGIYEIKMSDIICVLDVKKKVNASVLYKADEGKGTGKGKGKEGTKDLSAGLQGGGGDFDNFFGAPAKSKRNDDADFFGAGGGMGMGKGKGKGSAQVEEKVGVKQTFATEILAVTETFKSIDACSQSIKLDLKNCTRGVQGDIPFSQMVDEMDNLWMSLFICGTSMEAWNSTPLFDVFKKFETKEKLRGQVEMLKHVCSNEGERMSGRKIMLMLMRARIRMLILTLHHSALELFPDFSMKKNILTHLGYIDEEECVQIKGRVACEVNTCEER